MPEVSRGGNGKGEKDENEQTRLFVIRRDPLGPVQDCSEEGSLRGGESGADYKRRTSLIGWLVRPDPGLRGNVLTDLGPARNNRDLMLFLVQIEMRVELIDPFFNLRDRLSCQQRLVTDQSAA